jgi:hypothetical protein
MDPILLHSDASNRFNIFRLTQVEILPVEEDEAVPKIHFLMIKYTTFEKLRDYYMRYFSKGEIDVVVVDAVPQHMWGWFDREGFSSLMGGGRFVYYFAYDNPRYIMGKESGAHSLSVEEKIICKSLLGIDFKEEATGNSIYAGNIIPRSATVYRIGDVDIGIDEEEGGVNSIYISYVSTQTIWEQQWMTFTNSRVSIEHIKGDGDCNFTSLMYLVDDSMTMGEFKTLIWSWFLNNVDSIPDLLSFRNEIGYTNDELFMNELGGLFMGLEYDSYGNERKRRFLAFKFDILYHYVARVVGLKWVVVTEETVFVYYSEHDELVVFQASTREDIGKIITGHVCKVESEGKTIKYYNVLYKSENHYNLGKTPRQGEEKFIEPCERILNPNPDEESPGS